jgi:hypothetical protein
MPTRQPVRCPPTGPAGRARRRAPAAHNRPRPAITPLDPAREDPRFTPDFRTIFPYQAWESTSPAGAQSSTALRYRLVALRDDRADLFLLSVSILVPGEPPLTLARYEIIPPAFPAALSLLLTAISKAHGVSLVCGH